MPSLKDAIGYLYGLQKSGIKQGLKRIKRLLTLLGNPHREYPSILVAGTNGKGSTAAMLSNILTQAGYKTALYTSPHLLRFNERVRIDGREIGSRELTRLVFELRKIVDENMSACMPSFFEFTTALAFEHFRRNGVDIAVIEVGMGGTYDATNVVSPLVAVITTIGHDHTEYLGRTLKKIAREKAGIIKEGTKVVTAVEREEARETIERVSEDKGAALYIYGRDFRVEKKVKGLVYRGKETIEGIRPALAGGFQLKNTGCAIKVVELLRDMGYEVSKRAIREGISKVDWPARFQVLKSSPPIVLDCAHNPDGAAALVENLKGVGYRRLIVVAGMMKDKDVDAIMGNLSQVATTIICTRPAYWRSEEPERLKAVAERYGKRALVRKRVGRAVYEALRIAEKKDALCITGSVFTVAEAMRYLERKGYIRKP